MPIEHVTIARMRRGKLQIRDARFLAKLSRMRDGDVELIVRRKLAARNLNQNAAYWAGIVQPLADYTGFSPDELHTVLKGKFLPKRLAITNGNGVIVGEYVIGGTTTTLTIGEFSTYMDAITTWACDTLNIVLEQTARIDR